MLLTILLIVLLLIVLYLLFVPVILYIDTSSGQYFLQIKGVVKAIIETDKEAIIKIKLKLFLFHFYIYPLKSKRTISTKKIKGKTVKKKRLKKMSFQTFIKVLRSFKIKQFNIDVDTGDCISNAKLYPIFAFLNYRKKGFYINFEGRNTLLLSIENRPIRIIRSFINIKK